MQNRTRDLKPQRQPLLMQPFHRAQQLPTNKSEQSQWICSDTGGYRICLLVLAMPPSKAMTKMQNYAINHELAPTSCEVLLVLCNSVLLKRLVNNQPERGSSSRSHKMVPHVPKPNMLFTRQTRKAVDDFIRPNAFPGPASPSQKIIIKKRLSCTRAL